MIQFMKNIYKKINHFFYILAIYFYTRLFVKEYKKMIFLPFYKNGCVLCIPLKYEKKGCRFLSFVTKSESDMHISINFFEDIKDDLKDYIEKSVNVIMHYNLGLDELNVPIRIHDNDAQIFKNIIIN